MGVFIQQLCLCMLLCVHAACAQAQRLGYALHLPTIVIDPGHGGSDEGFTHGTCSEKNVTLMMAQALTRALQKRSLCNIVLTRTTDQDTSDQQRMDTVSKNFPTCFISLHTHHSTNVHTRGVKIYYAPKRLLQSKALLQQNHQPHQNSEELAYTLYQSLKSSVIMAEDTPLELPESSATHLPCPCVFIVLGYISNAKERTLLQKPHYLKSLAGILCDSLASFFAKLKN